MNTKQYPLIAREGWGRLALVSGVGLLLHFGVEPMAALPAWCVLALALYQFRDPTRSPPSLPLAVVSPIHGVVSNIAEARDPWLDREAVVVEIRSRFLDIRSIYSPTEGKIVDQWRREAHGQQSAVAYWIKTDEDDDVVLEIQPRGWHGPMSFRYHPGERVGQGRRVGFVNNGCFTKVYLPANSLIDVQQGQSAIASAQVLAHYV
ncbi:MAG: phosphatidylserine decarboxylase, partial [Pseudomonadota bacterium]